MTGKAQLGFFSFGFVFLALLRRGLAENGKLAAASSRAADFGGDFTASSMSGSDTPGPTSASMGSKAASAMAIGTGTAGTGNYAENYKTPNYTQYTNQDFKGLAVSYR